MMKASTILFSILSFLSGLIIQNQSTPQKTETVTSDPTPTIYDKQVVFHDESYAYDIIGPLHGDQVTLRNNLPSKKPSSELKSSFRCSYLVNGGFYGKDDKPIGLFVLNKNLITPSSQTSLFNGYISQTDNKDVTISSQEPDEDSSFALQAGPLLKEHASPKNLTIEPDQYARRMIVGISSDDQLYFISVFKPENFYTGPLLENLPEVINSIEKEESVQLDTAMNLDGGNHSAFYGSHVTLTELSPVGSFFCIK